MNTGPCDVCGGPSSTEFHVSTLVIPVCGRHGGQVVRALMALHPGKAIKSKGRWTARRAEES